jgi:hypothetical protein
MVVALVQLEPVLMAVRVAAAGALVLAPLVAQVQISLVLLNKVSPVVVV